MQETQTTTDVVFSYNLCVRSPVVFIVDASGSMSGVAINEVNAGLNRFVNELKEDVVASNSVDICIISFGTLVRIVVPFTNLNDVTDIRLQADGATPLGEAIECALDELEKRKAKYDMMGIPHRRPWVFLMTDGSSTDDLSEGSRRLRELVLKRRCELFIVGISGADFDQLRSLAPAARPPVLLKNMRFRDMFVWLSRSVSASIGVSKEVGEQISLPDISSWATSPAEEE